MDWTVIATCGIIGLMIIIGALVINLVTFKMALKMMTDEKVIKKTLKVFLKAGWKLQKEHDAEEEARRLEKEKTKS